MQNSTSHIGLPFAAEHFTDPAAAVERVHKIYEANTAYLRDCFKRFSAGENIPQRVHACYPFVRVHTEIGTRVDTRLSYGFVAGPGTYSTTVTRPDLFSHYFLEQFELLRRNHGVVLEVGVSRQPIPIHFTFPEGLHVEGDLTPQRLALLRDSFDLPDLSQMDDSIVNGTHIQAPDEPTPLALFTGPRVDYSLHRLKHYTATSPDQFQNFVLFTNYQFYIDEFIRLGMEIMSPTDDPEQQEYRKQYTAFVEPGDFVIPNQNLGGADSMGTRLVRLPQMPAYHLKRADGSGITMVNIGVGPSNAKTITDHIAVLRPHAWIMLGHCAGLRNTQRLGDYVLAHGYVREDHVLDRELPLWVPIPALAEMQVALEQAVEDVTRLEGFELKRLMRTGTVASVDNRNWEISGPEVIRRMSQSRAVALDMESAAIAANGYRFRVPYGTLLCVSDKPLHGEIKLAGMASEFYRRRVGQHLEIGLKALERLKQQESERLHSRKLRSFAEVAFQ